MYTNPRDHWLELNAKHTAQQMEVSDAGLLFSDAQKPAVHRFRYPQYVYENAWVFRDRLKDDCRALTQSSPFLNAVGSHVDMEAVVLRGEKEFD